MAEIRHGTKSGFNAGCRCDKCGEANSAAAYAARKVAQWDAPIRLLDPKRMGACYIDGDLVPNTILIEAVRRTEAYIKTVALQLWYSQKRKQKEKT